MNLRSYVEFETSFPDDEEHLVGSTPVRIPGHRIASMMIDKLKREKFDVSELYPRGEYGWEFVVSTSFLFIIQRSDIWLMISVDQGPFLQRWLNSKEHSEKHRQILNSVDDLIKNDGRFESIRWFTKEDFEKGADPALAGSHP